MCSILKKREKTIDHLVNTYYLSNRNVPWRHTEYIHKNTVSPEALIVMTMMNSFCCRSEPLKMVVFNHYLPKTLEKICKNNIWFLKYIIATMAYNFFHLLPNNANSSASHTDKSIKFLLAVISGLKKKTKKTKNKTSPQINSNEDRINTTFVHLRRLMNGK